MNKSLLLVLLFSLTIGEIYGQQVGVNTATPDASAALDVSSTTQGFLPPRMTIAERDAIVAPAEGLMVFTTDNNCLNFYNGTVWSLVCGEPDLPVSCLDILTEDPSATSGLYDIYPDGSTALPCYCDMTTDGGGWTLVLNYLHQGGTNPATDPNTTALPIPTVANPTAANLGFDDSPNAASWGHAAPALLGTLTFSEMRLYGLTSGHARVFNIKTNEASMTSYFSTGSGAVNLGSFNTNFTALPGHTALMMGTLNGAFGNEGANAMTNFPFYTAGNYHWGIRGAGNRWEVDDYPAGFGNNTIHQIWVR